MLTEVNSFAKYHHTLWPSDGKERSKEEENNPAGPVQHPSLGTHTEKVPKVAEEGNEVYT